MVTVEVGPQKVPFGFYKGLICSRSPFFEAAFNSSFQEAATQSFHLKDDIPEHLDIVHKLFYTDSLTVASDGKDKIPTGYGILGVYVLANKFDIPRLCDVAIKLISDGFFYHKNVPMRWVLLICERTGPNDRLRKWLIAFILQNYQYKHRRSHGSQSQSVVELSRAIGRLAISYEGEVCLITLQDPTVQPLQFSSTQMERSVSLVREAHSYTMVNDPQKA